MAVPVDTKILLLLVQRAHFYPEIALMAVCAAEMWYFVRNDSADYAAFKLLTATADRQRRYRAWILKSFLLFSGTTVAGLALLGRLRSLIILPPEFRSLSGRLQAAESPHALMTHLGSDFLLGLGGALAVGLIAGVVAARFLAKKKSTLAVGDIEPLMPRNWTETLHTAGLAINAGLSEELYFRLLLPMVLSLLFGNALAAFVAATAIFGLIHMYQGAAGVAATAVLGGVLTAIYLWTGNLWIAVSVHAAIDVIGLVVRPSLARTLAASLPART